MSLGQQFKKYYSKYYIFSLLFLFVSLNCLALSDTSEQKSPNVIIILTDDLGYGDIGAYGNTEYKTPNIDQIASNGIQFNQFYSAASVCTPARAGLLTGRFPGRMGIEHVFTHDSIDGMLSSEITIAEQLKSIGYATGMVGKWHLGHLDRFMPWNQGFDEFYGVPYSNDMKNFFFYNNKEINYSEIDQRYLTKTYTQKSIEFIKKIKSASFSYI